MSARQERHIWTGAILQNLSSVDEECSNFIQHRRVSIGFFKMGAHVSAIWAPGKRIFLNSRYFSISTDPGEPRLHSVLIHEVCHLKQGFLTALSVFGELEAWQLGFRVYQQLTGEPYHPNLVELMSLPLVWDRNVLRRAQTLMQVYASKSYRADLLPLYPADREIKFLLGLQVDGTQNL